MIPLYFESTVCLPTAEPPAVDILAAIRASGWRLDRRHVWQSEDGWTLKLMPAVVMTRRSGKYIHACVFVQTHGGPADLTLTWQN